MSEQSPGQKRAKILTARDPEYFSKMAKKRKRPYFHFRELKKKDPKEFKRITGHHK